ncbi:MAG: excinuclease ABC subunit UvrC [Pontibacterium sp.]
MFDSKAFLKNLTGRPGVYQMFDKDGELLYIGKAKNLKNRVSSYFRSNGHTTKTQALVAKIADIQVTVTGSETEALLLEQTMIKNHRPPYNILLRDDKSYPYIFVSTKDDYPAIRFHRGAQRQKGRYFGPFPSGLAVKDSLNLLQKVFQVRQCDDTFFRNRSRPCLQHQIKRCTAPCVDVISKEDYGRDVEHAMMFLQGKSQTIMTELAEEMEKASQALAFEQAAFYRDQIKSLQKVQESQSVYANEGDADVFGCAVAPGGVCVHLVFVRGGRVIGSKAFHPRVHIEQQAEEILASFLSQWYLASDRELPSTVITSIALDDMTMLSEALSQARGKKATVIHNVRGNRAGWARLAQTNAEQQLASHLANKQNSYNRLLSLQQLLSLDDLPNRIECFDISHSSGEATVASCVVFDKNGPNKQQYRHFNIEGITGGDDYAAMHQALTRRYTRIKKGEGVVPDLLLIDGGKGQVTQAMEVLRSLQLEQSISVVGVAKGPTRKAGFEMLIMGDTGEEVIPPSDAPGLHLIQHVRDEAHRFAITGHRARRAKARKRSQLEDIAGVGAKRRKALLQHFGSAKEVASASVEEIAKVSTISQTLAEQIYLALHPDA